MKRKLRFGSANIGRVSDGIKDCVMPATEYHASPRASNHRLSIHNQDCSRASTRRLQSLRFGSGQFGIDLATDPHVQPLALAECTGYLSQTIEHIATRAPRFDVAFPGPIRSPSVNAREYRHQKAPRVIERRCLSSLTLLSTFSW
jgi:hypothetical protein